MPGATPEGQPPLAPSEQDAESTEPFEFAGQSFKSREAAEQEVRTALGRYKTAQSEAAQATKRANEADRIAREAANLARAWQEHATGAQRQVVPQVQTPQEPEKPWIDTLDWDFAQELAEEKGLQTALYWTVQQMDARYNEMLDKRLKAALAPHEQRNEQSQKYQETMSTFNTVAFEVNQEGGLRFPELHDQSQAEEIVRIWSTLDPRLAMSPRGVRMAVLEYRDTNGVSVGQSSTGLAPAGGNGASQDVLRGARSSALASAEVLNGNGSPRPASPDTPGANSFKRLIGGAPATVRVGDLNLGFAPSF